MSQYPEPGPYYIFANVPTAGFKLVGATIKDDEEVLRVVAEQKREWTLTYVDRENGICTLSDTLLGGFLGVPNSILINNTIFRVKQEPGVQPQRWQLKKVVDGYTIGIEGRENFWHIGSIDGEVRAASSDSNRVQSWSFTRPDSD